MFGHGVFGRKKDEVETASGSRQFRSAQAAAPVLDLSPVLNESPQTLRDVGADGLGPESLDDPAVPDVTTVIEKDFFGKDEQTDQFRSAPCMSDPEFQLKMIQLVDRFGELFDTQYADLGAKRLDAHLNAAGALAGFGCQVSVRKALIEDCNLPEESMLSRTDAIDGRHFYTGDMLDEQLFSDNPNVITLWKLAEIGMEKLGEAQLPDFPELSDHVAKSFGTEEFGIPRIPDIHRAHHLPYEALFLFWENAP